MFKKARAATLFQLVVVLDFDLIKEPTPHVVAPLARSTNFLSD